MALSRRTAASDEARRRGEQAIFDATVGLLDQPAPFTDLSIAEITTAAGFSRATFYAYFSDKRDLLLRMGDSVSTQIYDCTQDWLDGKVDNTRETLAGVLDVFRANRQVLLALSEAATYDPEVAEFWQLFHRTFRGPTSERVQRDRPNMEPAQVNALSFVLVWMTETCMTQHLTLPEAGDEDFLDAMALLWAAAVDQKTP